MPSRRQELDKSYRFVLQLNGVDIGYFQRARGDTKARETIDLAGERAGAKPGATKFEAVTLESGYIVTDDLQAWWNKSRDDKGARRDLSIILNDNAANEVRRWRVLRTWPKQWRTDSRDSKGSDAATEEITFVVEDLQIA